MRLNGSQRLEVISKLIQTNLQVNEASHGSTMLVRLLPKVWTKQGSQMERKNCRLTPFKN